MFIPISAELVSHLLEYPNAFEHIIIRLYDEMSVSPESKQSTVIIFLWVVLMLCFVCSMPSVMLCSHESLCG